METKLCPRTEESVRNETNESLNWYDLLKGTDTT